VNKSSANSTQRRLRRRPSASAQSPRTRSRSVSGYQRRVQSRLRQTLLSIRPWHSGASDEFAGQL
jgi:hypothetical protein